MGAPPPAGGEPGHPAGATLPPPPSHSDVVALSPRTALLFSLENPVPALPLSGYWIALRFGPRAASAFSLLSSSEDVPSSRYVDAAATGRSV